MGFVENVNTIANGMASVNTVANDIVNIKKVAVDLVNVDIVATNVASINTVAVDILAVRNVSTNMDEVKKLNRIHDLGQLPLIKDTTPSTIDVYSSSKVQELHNAQQEAISNLSTCSGSLVMRGADIAVGTVDTILAFSPVIATTNGLLFVVGTDEIVVHANGTYNFTSVIELGLNTNGTRVLSFEVYDKNSLVVLNTTVGSINGSNGDIIRVPLNTLMVVDTVPYGGSITLKVRVKADIGVSDVTLRDFSSVLILSGASSGGGQLLGKAAMKAVGYLALTSSEVLVVPSGANAFSVDSFTLDNGGSLTVSNNSVYKVL